MYIYIYIHTYITFHYISLHFITFHYISLHYITYIHDVTLRYVTVTVAVTVTLTSHTYMDTYITIWCMKVHIISGGFECPAKDDSLHFRLFHGQTVKGPPVENELPQFMSFS